MPRKPNKEQVMYFSSSPMCPKHPGKKIKKSHALKHVKDPIENRKSSKAVIRHEDGSECDFDIGN